MTTCTRRSRPLIWLAATGLVLHAAMASAQPEDRQAARPLFDQGRELMEAGRYTEACPKLEQAVRLFAGAGLLLNLADCYEHTGQLASAWTRFGDAAAAAHRAGNAEAEAEANGRRSLVEPKLTRVVLQVTKEVPGLALSLNGQSVDRAQWNTPIAVDPGGQKLEAKAPGFRPWSSTQTAEGAANTVTVSVPALSPVDVGSPAAPAAASTPYATPDGADTTTSPSAATPADEGLGTRRIVALSLGAAGVVGLATGSVFGLMAISQKNQQQSDCGSTASCTGSGHAQALGDHSSAVSDGMISTVGFLAGGALLVAGAVVFLTGSSSAQPPATTGMVLTPSVGPSGAGFSWGGRC